MGPAVKTEEWFEEVLRSRQRFDDISLHDRTEEGFPWSLAEHTKQTLQLTDEQLATLMGKSKRTITRKRRDETHLTPGESDRLVRTLRVFAQACSVFEGREQAASWLKREQPGLGNRVPLKLLKTDAGARNVENLLGQIEHSVGL